MERKIFKYSYFCLSYMPELSLKHKLKVLKNTFLPILKHNPYMSHIWVTRHCNIHCKFCYIRDYSPPDPPLEELKKRLDKIREVGCQLTVIMGGEPTLRKDLPEIVKYCKKKDILSYLVTNGTLLDKKLADKLGKAGVDVISISLNTLTPKKNPLVKYGKYAYDPDEKLELLKYMQDKYDVIAFVAICITKLNIEEIVPIIELSKKYGLAVTLTAMADPYILPDVKDKSWKAEKDSVLFKTKEEISQLGKFMKKLENMKRKGHMIIDPYSYFERVENFLKNNKTNLCRAGEGFFDINTDGRIMLCVMSEPIGIHYSGLNKDNLAEKLKPFREKQLKHCCDNCMLAAYFDTSYYANHLIGFIKVIEKLY